MSKCKNIECNNSTKGNRIYCSLTCRNIYVNKYLRDYSNYNRPVIDKVREKYNKNPKKCITCNNKIPYRKRRNEFCNNSCKAIHVNATRKPYKRKPYSEEALKNISKANRKSKGGDINYESNPSKCRRCNKPLPYQKRNNKYCSRKCIQGNLNSLKIYRTACKFNFSLKYYPNEFDFALIEKHGWYKAKNRGNNLKGVSRDHMFSVRNGFELGIDPKIISHPANCRLMLHEDNFKKKDRSSIFLSDLLQRIKVWDSKYEGC